MSGVLHFTEKQTVRESFPKRFPSNRPMLCEHTFVRVLRFSVTEHDPAKPWIVVETTEHTAELAEEADFFAWAAERWPANRFTVQLAPWQLSPSRDEP
jgi:hypothetical protein